MTKQFDLAIEAAIKTGRYLKKMFYLPKDVCYKGEIDIVTDSDIKAEKIIINSIKKAFPKHDIVAEETKNFYNRKSKGFRWIIDPIDGTTNFAHGYPFFCVSIGLEFDGKIILGAIYNPLLNELFTAQAGRGAYLNNKKIKVSDASLMSKSLLSTGFPYDIRRDSRTNLKYFTEFQLKSLNVRRDGSAALDICYVACGRFDGFWELKLKPWDTAAASLILKEAGGKITNFNGTKYNIYKDETLATNGLIHNQMLEILKSS